MYFNLSKVNFVSEFFWQRVFDAEKISSCSFQVKAEDGDGFIQESTVTVDIKDWNDNRPLMEEEIFHGYVHENPKENSVVLNAKGQPLVIAARDDDVELRNRELKYEIISPGINNYFQLNENTGELFTSRVRLSRNFCSVTRHDNNFTTIAPYNLYRNLTTSEWTYFASYIN